MWPFKKYPTVTTEAYALWLRSHRPSWIWFFQRTPLEQQALAALGDQYVVDCATMAGEVEVPVSEEEKLRQLINGLEAPQVAPSAAPRTMGGITRRRQEAEQKTAEASQATKNKGRQFMGRDPDASGPDVEAIGPQPYGGGEAE